MPDELDSSDTSSSSSSSTSIINNGTESTIIDDLTTEYGNINNQLNDREGDGEEKSHVDIDIQKKIENILIDDDDDDDINDHQKPQRPTLDPDHEKIESIQADNINTTIKIIKNLDSFKDDHGYTDADGRGDGQETEEEIKDNKKLLDDIHHHHHHHNHHQHDQDDNNYDDEDDHNKKDQDDQKDGQNNCLNNNIIINNKKDLNEKTRQNHSSVGFINNNKNDNFDNNSQQEQQMQQMVSHYYSTKTINTDEHNGMMFRNDSSNMDISTTGNNSQNNFKQKQSNIKLPRTVAISSTTNAEIQQQQEQNSQQQRSHFNGDSIMEGHHLHDDGDTMENSVDHQYYNQIITNDKMQFQNQEQNSNQEDEKMLSNIIKMKNNTNNTDNTNNDNNDNDQTDYYYNKLPHWSQNIAIYPSLSIDECLISGGSDYGQMPYFTETGEIIIEIDDQQVAGLTSNDIKQLLSRSMMHTFKVLTGVHGFPLELREYLSRRFARGSLDHKLQEFIRDNIYSRTLPITTRPPRDNELDGVDYKFLTKEEFLDMERSGLLLESGVYCNYHYGTPFPPNNISSRNNGILKNNINNENNMENNQNNENSTSFNNQISDNGDNSWSRMNAMARRKRNRSNIVAIDAASLPFGWERISDAHYGVYYIDHINKRTQYERPYEIDLVKGISGFGFTLIEIDKGLIVVKSLIQGGSASASGVIQPGDVLVSVADVSVAGFKHSDIAHLFSTFNVGDRVRLTFARGYQLPINLNDEDYDIINLKIIKGYQGFGFTISEGHNGQKVKKILDLERCCSLRQGDILLSINGVDLTQMSHLDVVELLKQCPVNEPTEFMVKRKKRFRSKTPNNLHSMAQTEMLPNDNNQFHSPNSTLQSNTTNNVNNSLIRNCKTPNAEMFYPHHQQQQSQSNLAYQQPPPPLPNIYNKNFNNLNNPNHVINVNNNIDEYIPNEIIINNSNNPNPNENNYENQNQQMMMTMMNHYNSENGGNLYSNQMDYSNNLNTFINNKKSQSAPLLNPVSRLSSNYDNVVPNIPIDENSINTNNNINSPSDLPIFGNVDIDFEYLQVTLQRTETGFGFRIIGGSEDGSNVAIGSIVLGGSAHKDGTLKAGDELISINGQYVIGASHQEVVQLMSQTGSQVDIVVRRKRYLNAYDVTLQRQDYEGFGFVIISCGNCALIGRIIEGSPAHRCHRLHIRDRIIAVNGNDVTNMSHPEIVNLIKESDDILHLRIVPADCYSCELVRGPNGYGFSIRGGAEFNGMPLFILCIAANGPASSLLQVGDEILEINERSTIGMTHQEAVQLISQSAPSVRLRLRHNYGGGEFFNNLIRMPPQPTTLQTQTPSSSQISPKFDPNTQQPQQQQIESIGLIQPSLKPPPPPPPKPCLSSSKSLQQQFQTQNIINY